MAKIWMSPAGDLRRRYPDGGHAHARHWQAAGFTLLEMLVVLSIVAILSATAFAVARPQSGHGRLLIAVRELQTEIRSARQVAQQHNEETEIQFNLKEGSWKSADGAQHSLPKDTAVDLTVASFGDEDVGQARIRFYPDGSSTGGDIEITGGASTYKISVDWLTGRAILVEPQ